jgi:hypothetical protein
MYYNVVTHWIDTDLRVCKLLKNGGSEWGSNPPATGNLPPAGFEDRDDHRTACASRRDRAAIWAAARFSDTAWATSIHQDISVALPRSTRKAE